MIILKRVFDIALSFSSLIVLSPIMLITAIAIKLDSEGEIIFKQRRLTKDGREFWMYKFRTMVVGAEDQGAGLYNFKGDPRVTKVGAFLRKSSIDELPQLVNILFGDMSFVGPRPPVYYELGDFDKLNEDYKARFRMKAGLTGLAQVTGRNELEWDEKVHYDNLYIEQFKKYGIFLDIIIIIKTFLRVFKMKNIYEDIPEDIADLNAEDLKVEMTRRTVDKAKEKKGE